MNEKSIEVPTARSHYIIVALLSVVGMAIIYAATGEFSRTRFDLAIAEMLGACLVPMLIGWAGLRWWGGPRVGYVVLILVLVLIGVGWDSGA